MKYVPPIIALLALLFVSALPQRSVQGASDEVSALPEKPDAPLAVTSTPTPLPQPTDEPAGTATPEPPRIPGRACLRINFEVSGDVAQVGTYEVAEVSGRSLASWDAQDGWQDSGWIYDLEISYDAVYVNVFYHPADGSDSITMAIFNPAPDTEYGWVARGMCHAVEVGWP
ncbi:MAG: hypothetical protein CL608_07755 [Anaerolineaceae bacterium]|nr:hypothetical protein [Anaerolineaceae bacterium]